MEERRRYKRFNAEGSVILKVEGSVILKVEEEPVRSLNTDLADISFLGIGVYAPEIINPGSKVQFELHTKFFDAPLTGKGRIKYVLETKSGNATVFRTGIEFTRIEEKPLQELISRVHADTCTDIRKKEQQLRKKKPFSLDF